MNNVIDTYFFLGPLLLFEVILCWIWRPLPALPGITSPCLCNLGRWAWQSARLGTGELAKKFPMSKSRSTTRSEGTPPMSLGNRPGGGGGAGGAGGGGGVYTKRVNSVNGKLHKCSLHDRVVIYHLYLLL